MTNSGSFCDVADPIRPSVGDKLTTGTKVQILKLNTYGEKYCNW